MRFYKTPALVRGLLPQYTWRQPAADQQIYLTFDDGPIPDVTEFVLAQLAQYQAQATFFCVGENMSRYPDIARQIVAQGHRLGNHTYHHLRGWDTETDIYVQNIALCQAQIELVQPHQSQKLFRPPHGRIRRAQFQKIKTDYQVILWDVLTYDFEATLAPAVILRQTLKYTAAGSIVVMHDSVKARRNLQHILPRLLEHFAQRGYRFVTL